MTDITNEPAGWRPYDWLRAAGYPFSLPILYREIKAGRLDACKVGGGGKNTVILTSPREYFAKMPRGVSPALGRGRSRKAAVT
jgi:hypothetical protein